ncbi:hypothetical protein MSM1_20790 [Mycobacterium sp. SM1]|uniref:hypothetical protein n=1 Tax=Mycobacterium sp. SM1 TaxID=2816243 RepID=UPI001BD039E7|nr:hypothetical protein [Mycobacterium sp. SM1]MBS4730646.1 hypothetical protein [Mycobacterium sp. SM1]
MIRCRRSHPAPRDPLPHQTRAVYGEMLARTPLRFLLADDRAAAEIVDGTGQTVSRRFSYRQTRGALPGFVPTDVLDSPPV